jgi:hypothetical protein
LTVRSMSRTRNLLGRVVHRERYADHPIRPAGFLRTLLSFL